MNFIMTKVAILRRKANETTDAMRIFDSKVKELREQYAQLLQAGGDKEIEVHVCLSAYEIKDSGKEA